jgi:hypothetical protein
VIDAARAALVGLVLFEARSLPDVVLKVRLVLTEIMPEARESPPVPIAEDCGELFCQGGYAVHMVGKKVRGSPSSVLSAFGMGYELLTHIRLLHLGQCSKLISLC